MKIRCLCFCLLFCAATVGLATEIRLKSDKSVVAEVAENKATQSFTLTLTFKPVTTLDVVTNYEMTRVFSDFFAEEVLSSYLDSLKQIDYGKTKFVISEKSKERWIVSYEIPKNAISDAVVVEKTIANNELKKCLLLSQSDAIKDYRSSCFRDLRTLEAFFADKINGCKDKESLKIRIEKAFNSLYEKIEKDDALFLAEKDELQTQLASVKRFLLKKLKGNAMGGESSLNSEKVEIRKAKILAEYKPFLQNSPILLESGGCMAFQMDDGKTILITVGMAEVKADTAVDRIRRKNIAEQRAYGELAKYENISVTYFSSLDKNTEIMIENGIEKSHLKKRKHTRTTVKSIAYFDDVITVGEWYSADEKQFYVAKGCVIPVVEEK